MQTCVNCKAALEDSVQFCSQCGTPVGEHQTCPQCNKPLPLAAKYCMYCGTKLPEQSKVPATQEKTAADQTPENQSQQTESLPDLDTALAQAATQNLPEVLATVEQLFYEQGKEEEALDILEPLYKIMPENDLVLSLYIPVLAETDHDKALEFIDSLQKQCVTAYTTAAAIAIEQRDFDTATAKINQATRQWQGNFYVIYHAALLAFARYYSTGDITLLQEANTISSQLTPKPTKLEKSYAVKIKSMILAAKNNTPFNITPEYCKQNGLYTAFTCKDPINPTKIEMVPLSGSFYQMGSADDGPIHTEYLTSFAIGKYPVTQRLYKRIMGNNPSTMKGNNRPVDSVSWYDCIVFCNLLSMMAHLTPCYSIKDETNPANWGPIPEEDNDASWDNVKCNSAANGYRLPTEPEWEFAAKGGPQQDLFIFAGSNNIDDIAWHIKNSDRHTHSVGKKQPNSLSLYDMSGNISEWCWDWYRPYTLKPLKATSIPVDKPYRVRRGGSWGNFASGCSVTFRNYGSPAFRFNNYGFRLCMSITE